MDWQDIKVAYAVSQRGTVSGAAELLGVHHATVIRHVDRLEKSLGQKLFIRHAKGYEPTEAGQALFNVAAVANEQFTQAEARIDKREAGISGKIVITTLPNIGDLFMPAFADFHRQYPEVLVRLEISWRVFRLEYGEAHLALRAGERPTDPDNVVVKLLDLPMALFASRAYTERYGLFDGTNKEAHYFVGANDSNSRDPYNKWLASEGLMSRLSLDCSEMQTRETAIRQGLGIGFMRVKRGQADKNLIEHMPTRPEWNTEIWQVTHRDMHRTPKVQAMAACIENFVKSL